MTNGDNPSQPSPRGFFRRALKEPLLHFTILGAVIFGINSIVDPEEPTRSDREILIAPGRIAQLSAVFAKTRQRPPTEVELRGLVDEYILQEVYYRKAKEMGIDNDDTVIRRRLQQKLEFLVEDSTLVNPSEQELAAYLKSNAARFTESPRYTFEHRFYNPENHGDDLDDFLASQLKLLRSGTEQEGDRTLMSLTFSDSTSGEIDSAFGNKFSENFVDLKEGEWSGTFTSGYGYHLIRLESRQKSRIPELDEVGMAVSREWQNERRQENRRAINTKLLEEFTITVEWPKE